MRVSRGSHESLARISRSKPGANAKHLASLAAAVAIVLVMFYLATRGGMTG